MHHRSTAAFAEFDMQSPVEVQVRLMKPQTLQADSLPPLVRPSERGIAFTLSEGGTVMQFWLCLLGSYIGLLGTYGLLFSASQDAG